MIRNLRERIHKIFFLKTILPIFGRSLRNQVPKKYVALIRLLTWLKLLFTVRKLQ
ncbi:hypothetical protein LEP1GSC008_0097 [Leptospira kirschneri serovar Bulgarica str. Nikolaevo]|uniref:Uncharacterized protein n=1 Tax=Leptospira kirschneri serovar Bulgarica str. Nikolaevo TaxID=1240687 RepID=M6F6N5_9LEPT|nr:hypothetical protein LEP1GSC008_0097 [Leptospira kirschneri serovar Bulgarica str. Nikolaevo]